MPIAQRLVRLGDDAAAEANVTVVEHRVLARRDAGVGRGQRDVGAIRRARLHLTGN